MSIIETAHVDFDVPAEAAPHGVTKVLIVSENGITRAGMRSVLGDAAGLRVVADVADPHGAAVAVRATRPDVVVLTALPTARETAELVRTLAALADPPRIIVLAETSPGPRFCLTVLRAGACGFLVRDIGADVLVRSVRAVMRDGAVVSPEAARYLLNVLGDVDIERMAKAREAMSRLSSREREVLDRVASGLGNAQIGRAMYMSESSIKAYVSRLLVKLNCENRVQAAMLWRDARQQW